MLNLCPATLPNSFIRSRSFCVQSFLYAVLYHLHIVTILPLPFQFGYLLFFNFFGIIAMARTSNTMLNKNCESHSKFPLAIYFPYGIVNFHVTLSIHLSFSHLPSPHAHRSVLYVCFSVTINVINEIFHVLSGGNNSPKSSVDSSQTTNASKFEYQIGQKALISI